jgi:hypothetical protein
MIALVRDGLVRSRACLARSCPLLKMLRENTGEPLRCPSDAILNLIVDNLENPKVAIRTLNNVNGLEPVTHSQLWVE